MLAAGCAGAPEPYAQRYDCTHHFDTADGSYRIDVDGADWQSRPMPGGQRFVTFRAHPAYGADGKALDDLFAPRSQWRSGSSLTFFFALEYRTYARSSDGLFVEVRSGDRARSERIYGDLMAGGVSDKDLDYLMAGEGDFVATLYTGQNWKLEDNRVLERTTFSRETLMRVRDTLAVEFAQVTANARTWETRCRQVDIIVVT